MSQITRFFMAISMALMLSMPQLSLANSAVVKEEPSPLAMTGDLIIVRPLALAATVLGAAIFLVSLPFSLLGGNAGEAGETLVLGPAETTFVRCLGCTQNGYKRDVEDAEEEEQSSED